MVGGLGCCGHAPSETTGTDTPVVEVGGGSDRDRGGGGGGGGGKDRIPYSATAVLKMFATRVISGFSGTEYGSVQFSGEKLSILANMSRA